MQNRNRHSIPSSIEKRLEFHRRALALMPEPGDKHPGVAFFLASGVETSFCSCSKTKKKTCEHLKTLFRLCGAKSGKQHKPFDDDLKQSLWYRMAHLLAVGAPLDPASLSVGFYQANGRKALGISDESGKRQFTDLSTESAQYRLADRMGAFGLKTGARVPDRAEVLRRLRRMTISDTERMLNEKGLKSRRQAFEGTFWYRLAYHLFREVDARDCHFVPSVNETTGDFMLSCRDASDRVIFHLHVPRTRVRALLESFRELLPNQHHMPIHPLPLKSIFKISRNTALDLDIRPMVALIQDQGESRFFERAEIERFRYGDLVYVKELGLLAELEDPNMPRHFRSPVRMQIKKHQIPSFLDDVGDALFTEQFQIDPDVKGLKLLRRVDRVELAPAAIDRDWCWLSIAYGFGNARISLQEILAARKDGRRYIGTPDGWVDCTTADMDHIAAVAQEAFQEQPQPGQDRWKLSRKALFRIGALGDTAPVITGSDENADTLQRLLAMKAVFPLPAFHMATPLRQYQLSGLHWLWWLYENGFGGLLCDDMGLGKTHQVMALMLCIKAFQTAGQRFVVVCPTTVLSHWMVKIEEHAPGLKAGIYHGIHRDKDEIVKDADVLITSYGVLLRDIEALQEIDFSLAVFDEIQAIKNKDTQTHRAASALKASMKLGLTGTPIENRIFELKALMDVTVPGFLGSDDSFSRRYLAEHGGPDQARQKTELRRLIFPFTLRRLKQRVLKELPPKIEDIRYCSLSDDQVKLYRDAVAARVKRVVALLEDSQKAVPYIHIFALLSLLKQICNHPAMVKKAPDDFEQYRSGKWELFKELLQESLDAGQKVVVYSQFVEMIRIMAIYLRSIQVDFETLTGQTRNRGRRIERFNNDPECRVFVGSLKAGGTGIDLIAASVVIHYDRWWNAAKEDQATDRVHRIGQQRGVQVFKLVTQGTLEEKISHIIEKKRELMESIVREDDPSLLKHFSRQELVDLLVI